MKKYTVRVPVDFVIEVTANEDYLAEEHALKYARDLAGMKSSIGLTRSSDRLGRAVINSITTEVAVSVTREDLTIEDKFNALAA